MHSTEDRPSFLQPPESSNELGWLGDYRIFEKLGQGGMGVVYRGEDRLLRRSVAIKVMLPEYAQLSIARERFLREAQAMAALKSDHIVTIYQVGQHNGIPFLAMELLLGQSLNDYVRDRLPLPAAEIAQIGIQVARGLAAAHAQGLIHRDIKPSNLWVESLTGRVKILDFGLAKPLEENKSLTQSGLVIGTPAYMSPEQTRGEEMDHRSDLFSLGVVLYQLCVGKLPFEGTTAIAALAALLTDQPVPVQQRNPKIPDSLAQVVHSLLAKNPHRRPESAQQVAYMLEQTVAQGALTSSLSRLTWRLGRVWPWLAGLGIPLLLLGVLALLGWFHSPSVLEITAPDTTIVVLVERDGQPVVTIDPKRQPLVALPPGIYRLRLETVDPQLRLSNELVQMESGQKYTVTVEQRASPSLPAKPTIRYDPATLKDCRPSNPEEWTAWGEALDLLDCDTALYRIFEQIERLNPQYKREFGFGEIGGRIVSLEVNSHGLKDITPFRYLRHLRNLKLYADRHGRSDLSDLSPLRGRKFEQLALHGLYINDLKTFEGANIDCLDLSYCQQIVDFSPLRKARIQTLRLWQTRILDLTPIAEIESLKSLAFGATSVTDLTPLARTKISELFFSYTAVRDLRPIRGLQLKRLHIHNTQVTDLEPLRGMPLQELSLRDTNILDLEPIRNSPLVIIRIGEVTPEGREILRSIKTLKVVNDQPASEFFK